MVMINPVRVAGTFVDSNKDSINNRSDCAGEHIKNNTKSFLYGTAVAGSAAGVTYAAFKNEKVADGIIKGLKSVRDVMSKNKYTGKVAGWITKALSSLPKAGKIGVIAAAIAAPVLYLIDHQNTYKAGQIDQKYTDKATVDSQLDNFITLNRMS